MTTRYHQLMFTTPVLRAQEETYGRSRPVQLLAGRDRLTEDEAAFISTRDSCYLSTVNEAGWPYVQHRGGPPGFLRVIDAGTLVFADYEGNRQLLTVGHLRNNDRVALLLMDYPQQTRLKLLGHARIEPAEAHPVLSAELSSIDAEVRAQRLIFIDIVAYDWNCAQHITPRFTVEQIERFVAPLQERITELEARLADQAPRVTPSRDGPPVST